MAEAAKGSAPKKEERDPGGIWRMSRRDFFSFLGWSGVIATLGGILIGTLRFFFPRTLFEPPTSFRAGRADEYDPGEPDQFGVISVSERWKKQWRVWVVRARAGGEANDRIYAIYGRCTHLGCTPNWFADEKVYRCPCHGSQYRSNGVNFAGPAPRPMERAHVTIAEDGQVIVNTAILYDHTRFDNPNSYAKVTRVS
jgi:cytochrome b6-f complex iron-sulfur subunit